MIFQSQELAPISNRIPVIFFTSRAHLILYLSSYLFDALNIEENIAKVLVDEFKLTTSQVVMKLGVKQFAH